MLIVGSGARCAECMNAQMCMRPPTLPIKAIVVNHYTCQTKALTDRISRHLLYKRQQFGQYPDRINQLKEYHSRISLAYANNIKALTFIRTCCTINTGQPP